MLLEQQNYCMIFGLILLINVASRMDSTGEKRQIQVPEHVALAFSNQIQIFNSDLFFFSNLE